MKTKVDGELLPMDRRGDNYLKAIERILSIIVLLGKGEVITTKQLSDKLKVCQRTIQRDMRILVKVKAYRVYEVSRGRYSINPDDARLKDFVEAPKDTIFSRLFGK
jgi:transcriptional antiterminator